jgi:hypothetical protein
MAGTGRFLLAVGLVVAAAAGLAADTLYLRDGTRVGGQLVSIRNGIVEFQPDRGRLIRVNLAEVQRIEFEGRRADRGASSFAPGARRPAGLRERRVTVQARSGWTDTGIDVRAGQTVYFEATGQVTWGRGRRDGPAGERNSPDNDARPLPTRPAAALIGRIGEDSGAFFIGDEQGGIRVRESGRLFLGINDDYLLDNSGNFRVVVYH